MPYKDGLLTPKESAFAEAFAKYGRIAEAEAEAGIAKNYGYKLIARPEVLVEIRNREQAKLVAEALPEAIDTLLKVMRSDKSPAAARVAAAKVVLDRTLGVAEGGAVKEPHEMTPDELAQAINTMEAHAAALATPVSAPNPYD